MGEADLDVLVATSRHNVQYLLGGYRFFFFDVMEAIGVSRYLPVVVYQRGRSENTLYVGNGMESFERELQTIPAPIVKTSAWGTLDATEAAVKHIKQLGHDVRRVGIEPSFLPSDARQVLGAQLGNVELRDAQFVLERLRAVKTAAEIELIRQASARVVGAMQAT
ncbi:MAG: aminopeptidase P family N-terminal domain-containing protein, partial [Tardiphaga sp.]